MKWSDECTCITIAKMPLDRPVPRWEVYTEGWKNIERTMDRKRVDYLADRRNGAVENALKHFPDTETMILVDSYYMKQIGQISKLLKCFDGNEVLGGSTWVQGKQFKDSNHFWDCWTTPEASQYNVYDVARLHPKHLKVQAVGGVLVFPRILWDMGARFRARDNWHRGLGCEMNGFCEDAENLGFSSFLCFDSIFEHPSSVPIARQMMKHFLDHLPKGVFST